MAFFLGDIYFLDLSFGFFSYWGCWSESYFLDLSFLFFWSWVLRGIVDGVGVVIALIQYLYCYFYLQNRWYLGYYFVASLWWSWLLDLDFLLVTRVWKHTSGMVEVVFVWRGDSWTIEKLLEGIHVVSMEGHWVGKSMDNMWYWMKVLWRSLKLVEGIYLGTFDFTHERWNE